MWIIRSESRKWFAIFKGSLHPRGWLTIAGSALCLTVGMSGTASAGSRMEDSYRVSTEKHHVTLKLVVLSGSLREGKIRQSRVTVSNRSHRAVKYVISGCARPPIYDRVLDSSGHTVWQPTGRAGKNRVCPMFVALVTILPGHSVHLQEEYRSPKTGRMFVQALAHLSAPHIRLATPKVPITVS